MSDQTPTLWRGYEAEIQGAKMKLHATGYDDSGLPTPRCDGPQREERHQFFARCVSNHAVMQRFPGLRERAKFANDSYEMHVKNARKSAEDPSRREFLGTLAKIAGGAGIGLVGVGNALFKPKGIPGVGPTGIDAVKSVVEKDPKAQEDFKARQQPVQKARLTPANERQRLLDSASSAEQGRHAALAGKPPDNPYAPEDRAHKTFGEGYAKQAGYLEERPTKNAKNTVISGHTTGGAIPDKPTTRRLPSKSYTAPTPRKPKEDFGAALEAHMPEDSAPQRQYTPQRTKGVPPKIPPNPALFRAINDANNDLRAREETGKGLKRDSYGHLVKDAKKTQLRPSTSTMNVPAPDEVRYNSHMNDGGRRNEVNAQANNSKAPGYLLGRSEEARGRHPARNAKGEQADDADPLTADEGWTADKPAKNRRIGGTNKDSVPMYGAHLYKPKTEQEPHPHHADAEEFPQNKNVGKVWPASSSQVNYPESSIDTETFGASKNARGDTPQTAAGYGQRNRGTPLQPEVYTGTQRNAAGVGSRTAGEFTGQPQAVRERSPGKRKTTLKLARIYDEDTDTEEPFDPRYLEPRRPKPRPPEDFDDLEDSPLRLAHYEGGGEHERIAQSIGRGGHKAPETVESSLKPQDFSQQPQPTAGRIPATGRIGGGFRQQNRPKQSAKKPPPKVPGVAAVARKDSQLDHAVNAGVGKEAQRRIAAADAGEYRSRGSVLRGDQPPQTEASKAGIQDAKFFGGGEPGGRRAHRTHLAAPPGFERGPMPYPERNAKNSLIDLSANTAGGGGAAADRKQAAYDRRDYAAAMAKATQQEEAANARKAASQPKAAGKTKNYPVAQGVTPPPAKPQSSVDWSAVTAAGPKPKKQGVVSRIGQALGGTLDHATEAISREYLNQSDTQTGEHTMGKDLARKYLGSRGSKDDPVKHARQQWAANLTAAAVTARG